MAQFASARSIGPAFLCALLMGGTGLQLGAAAAAAATPNGTRNAATSSTSTTRAEDVFGAFTTNFWRTATHTFFARSDHDALESTGKTTPPMWWVAEAWETVMDDHQVDGSAWTRSLIDKVYDGFTSESGFNSPYNDDRGWWALAATRAYELTGEQRFLTFAIDTADTEWTFWDSTFGGGIWWKRTSKDQKNVATNAPAAITNGLLYELTGKTRFKKRAEELFAWVDTTLRSGGRLDDRIEARSSRRIAVDYTYNYGTYIGAALELYQITGAQSYIDKATSLADSAMSRLTSNGVLRDEGAGDGGAFKGIFVRYLTELAREPASVVPSSRTSAYRSFLVHNADVAWQKRTSSLLWGTGWTSQGSPPIEMATDMSAVELFDAVAALN